MSHTLMRANGLQMEIIREMETRGRDEGGVVICKTAYLSELDIVLAYPISPSHAKAHTQTTAVMTTYIKTALLHLFIIYIKKPPYSASFLLIN